MILKLTSAAPPFKGNKLLINSELIASVYTDNVKWVNTEDDASPDEVEKELVTCISASGVSNLFFVQESIEEIYALVNTKN
jgi:hypothetical protein